MRGVNKAIILGTVGRDPEVRVFENGEIVTFSLATNEVYKDRLGNLVEKTEWHNIVIGIPNLCEIAKKYVRKGDIVYVEGRIVSRQYERPEIPNVKFTSYDIKVNSLTLVSSKQRSAESLQSEENVADAPPHIEAQQELNSQEDDLPF
ncbi:MAG: single-stranded DNA-binding protein [Bacteroidia bacterium]|nr:single-stranded DNA-binding protein [Bacteroidia bacterium]MDW8301946.1 single-stranded DNA-binding protein [Bacteroidia bacterium]